MLAVIAVTYDLCRRTPPGLQRRGPQQHVGCSVRRSKGRAATEHVHRCQAIVSLNYPELQVQFFLEDLSSQLIKEGALYPSIFLTKYHQQATIKTVTPGCLSAFEW